MHLAASWSDDRLVNWWSVWFGARGLHKIGGALFIPPRFPSRFHRAGAFPSTHSTPFTANLYRVPIVLVVRPYTRSVDAERS